MTRPLRLLLAAVIVLGLAACAEEPQPTTATAAQPGEPATVAPAPATPPATDGQPADAAPAQASARAQAVTERIEQMAQRRQERQLWWNDAELAATLGLSPEQQLAMDRRFEEHQNVMQQTHTGLRQARRDYREALRAGELAAARDAVERSAAFTAEQVRQQQLLAIELLESVEPAQRQLLVEQYQRQLMGRGAGAGLRAQREGRGDGKARREGRQRNDD